MSRIRRVVSTIINLLPGTKYGFVGFLPYFFFLGAGIELAMIKWRPLGVNFYDVYMKKNLDSEALSSIERDEKTKTIRAYLANKEKSQKQKEASS